MPREAVATRTFASLFDAEPEAAADAPGRVNLMGEHTDYHEGFVLPTIIPQRTRVEIGRRRDREVHAWSAAMPQGVSTYGLGSERRENGWIDYVQGVTAALAARGHTLAGFNLRIESAVPVGAGVSSSAALEIALLRAVRRLFQLALDDVEIARVGRAAETDFVGAPVGIMDQMASSLGAIGHALFLDTRSLEYERLPLPDAADLIVIDSGITHQHAGGAYVDRRRESFEAAQRLGVRVLRDLTPDALPAINRLPPVLARRARHVVTENQRVLDAAAALREHAAARLGALFNESHASMRDDYQTSTPEIDTLVAIAQEHAQVFGARLTGGGFGGAVVILTARGTARASAEQIVERYRAATRRNGAVLVP